MSTDYLYRGSLSSSKSIYNRALIVQSYGNGEIHGSSQSSDIEELTKSLQNFQQGQTHLFAGQGGTSFRFLLPRVSRQKGEYTIEVAGPLAERPHEGLIKILSDLGVSVRQQKNIFTIHSDGWKDPQKILHIDSVKSSQFASALVLNAWDLDFNLSFIYSEGSVSESYFQMTLSFLKNLGMQIHKKDSVYTIPRGQKCNQKKIEVEMDVSSAFSLCAFAYFGKAIRLENFPFQSLQPDVVFLDCMTQMGFEVLKVEQDLIVNASPNLRPLKANLSQCPDLFPVLACLCACIEGTSELQGATQLVYKESNRLLGIQRLFDLCDINYENSESGFKIKGRSPESSLNRRSQDLIFDPLHDHRMAMAAGFLKKAGYPLKIINSNVVNKSFSDFWSLVRIEI